MLMFPWIFHALSNLILSEIYNNIDNVFNKEIIWLPISICTPFIFSIIGIFAFILVFRRKIGSRSFRKRING